MKFLITGGSACGKSTYAEALALRLCGPRFYIATMRPYDDECVIKIARHRKQRQNKGFITIERYTELLTLALPERGTALLECMCNLTANEMFDPVSFELRDPFDDIMSGISAIEAQCENLVVVTNEVGSDGVDYEEGTRRYIETLGKLNRTLAERCDNVYEMVCGIPILLKGELL